MVQGSLSLMAAVRQYHLQFNGVSFWTPYWINRNEPPYSLEAPLRGKGSGFDVAAEFQSYLKLEPVIPADVHGMRLLMRTHRLGVDCSGFVYHVLKSWLRHYHIYLDDHLVVERSEIETVIRQHPERANLLPLAQHQTLRDVCMAWGKSNPADITHVMRLVNPKSVIEITEVRNILPGDLIKTSGPNDDHIGIITAANDRVVTFYSANDQADGFGGVTRHTMVVTDRNAGLEAQNWFAASHCRSGWRRNGIWRLQIIEVTK